MAHECPYCTRLAPEDEDRLDYGKHMDEVRPLLVAIANLSRERIQPLIAEIAEVLGVDPERVHAVLGLQVGGTCYAIATEMDEEHTAEMVSEMYQRVVAPKILGMLSRILRPSPSIEPPSMN